MPFDIHRQLQERYAGHDGTCEVRLDGGFVADVMRHGVIYEVQTQALRRIRAKVAELLDTWPVVVVFPVVRNTTIVYCQGEPPAEYARRTSPKHGTPLDAFVEAASIAKALAHENLTLDLLLVDVEERRLRRTEAEQERLRRRRRRWRNRRGLEWATINRRIVAVHETIRLDTPADGVRLLPETLAHPFTTKMLGAATGLSRRRAGQVAYTLRHMGSLAIVGRTKEGLWYRPVPPGAQPDTCHLDPTSCLRVTSASAMNAPRSGP